MPSPTSLDSVPVPPQPLKHIPVSQALLKIGLDCVETTTAHCTRTLKITRKHILCCPQACPHTHTQTSSRIWKLKGRCMADIISLLCFTPSWRRNSAASCTTIHMRAHAQKEENQREVIRGSICCLQANLPSLVVKTWVVIVIWARSHERVG